MNKKSSNKPGLIEKCTRQTKKDNNENFSGLASNYLKEFEDGRSMVSVRSLSPSKKISRNKTNVCHDKKRPIAENNAYLGPKQNWLNNATNWSRNQTMIMNDVNHNRHKFRDGWNAIAGDNSKPKNSKKCITGGIMTMKLNSKSVVLDNEHLRGSITPIEQPTQRMMNAHNTDKIENGFNKEMDNDRLELPPKNQKHFQRRTNRHHTDKIENGYNREMENTRLELQQKNQINYRKSENVKFLNDIRGNSNKSCFYEKANSIDKRILSKQPNDSEDNNDWNKYDIDMKLEMKKNQFMKEKEYLEKRLSTSSNNHTKQNTMSGHNSALTTMNYNHIGQSGNNRNRKSNDTDINLQLLLEQSYGPDLE